VSRCHAVIRQVKDEFFLEDNNSKFGTLVLVKEPIKITHDMPVSIQAGRSLLTFILKKPFALFNNCFGYTNFIL